ncbi:energy-coupling factor transporter transmembrane component T family protein [Oceanobacillus neutriphilus]|uniref:Energy-coupling factor transporter transmembrane protein EcfT n=1 Tax=Oceanobacillus neutriphilus TaxID=531815 RepID=A0ABQ2NV96_9BACI|nr:energy-coupling factor transporter transmembrane component T [Oceanobacillus neutriphilus]GGP11221.1 energy-coupling factor transporter transmembrane protein EcfT [Oceanobacillus neutriphilus]
MAKKSGTFYEPLDSPIERLDPITKFVAIFALGLSSVVFPSVFIGYVILLGLFFVAYKAKILKKFAKFIIGFAIPIMVMLFFIQGFYNPDNVTIIADLGFAQLGLEGILKMLNIVGSLLVFLGSFYITTKTTDTGRMVASFQRVGITGKAGYLILATLNVIPQMQKKVSVIQEAQNSRGLETSGSLKTRLKAIVPLIGPLIMGSLIDVQERGMTLEVRGFGMKGIKQTNFVQAEEAPVDKKIKRLFLIYFLLIIVASIIIRFNLI